MLIKAILLVFVWATTFQAGKSIYFSQTEVNLKGSANWEIHKNIYQARALLEPDESGQVKYSLLPKNGKHCAVMNISQGGQIFLESQPSNLKSDKKCNYLLEAELIGKAGMEKRTKANMTLAVALPGGAHPDESICKRKPDEQLCFGGIEVLHVQVMENSEKVLVTVLGLTGQACSVGLKYSAVATAPANESEGVFTIEVREDRSELWIESNLDRESVMSYNFSIICSVPGDSESVNQFVLPGILTVLDQDDNSPMITSNTSLRTVSIPLHSGKNTVQGTRLEPEGGGHTTLSFVDADTPEANNFALEIVNDTKQLLAINISSIHSIVEDYSSYCFVVLKAELRTSSIIPWDGMYCVLVNVNDTSLVGNHMETKISFNVCLHFGIEPTTTKLPLQESEKVDCGPMCQVIIIVVFVGLAGVIVTVFILRNYKMTKRKSRSVKPPGLISPNSVLMTASYGHHSGNGNVISTGMDYIEPGAETNALTARAEYFPVDSKWEVPRTALVLEEVLGEGEFGRVLKAKFQNPNDTTGNAGVVAVKMLKDNEASGRSCKQEFMAEFSLLKQVDHHNVIKLLGACTSGPGPYYLIMEFAEFKSLRSFLRKCRKIESLPNTSAATFRTNIFGAVAAEDNGWDQSFTVTPNEILGFSWQIAKGMAYLSDMKMVHRDLAARNVLLTSKKVCKISDFGLTRDIYVDDAYKKKSKDRVPVKWLAPECLADELYTTKSDVWAYGVLLWELANMGASPYPGIPSEQLYFLLKTGYRMPQPPNCSFQFYGLMRQCWADDPANRPTFRHLVTALGVLLEDGIDYIQLNIPSVSNPAYEVYNTDLIPSSSAFLKTALRSSSLPLFAATDESQREGLDVSVENLRLIDHEISTCEDSSLETSTEYNNTFVVHTYMNNEHNKEESQTATNSSQGPNVPISSSAYESPIKIKSVSFNNKD